MPLGIIAKAIKPCSNPQKWWVQTEDGQSYWPMAKYLEVVKPAGDPSIFLTGWEKKKLAEGGDGGNELLTLLCKRKRKAASGKAIQVMVIHPGEEASRLIWLPVSQCDGLATLKGTGTVMCPRWLAKKKGVESYAQTLSSLSPDLAAELVGTPPILEEKVEAVTVPLPAPDAESAAHAKELADAFAQETPFEEPEPAPAVKTASETDFAPTPEPVRDEDINEVLDFLFD